MGEREKGQGMGEGKREGEGQGEGKAIRLWGATSLRAPGSQGGGQIERGAGKMYKDLMRASFWLGWNVTKTGFSFFAHEPCTQEKE